MKNWKDTLVNPATPIREVIKKIDQSSMQIAVVVDEHNGLMGTVTDGDVRRGILKGISLDEPVRRIMMSNPLVSQQNEDRNRILTTMKEKQVRHVPIVDDRYRVVRLEVLDEMIRPQTAENIIILMAGGLGSRLRPLTEDCPKALLKIGPKPILEIILENLIEYGFRRFYFSVHYKEDMIEDYFKDGTRWNVDIRYLREQRCLGTGGALSLIPEEPKQPMILMNGDLLTKINFHHLLDFHHEHKSHATVCICDYEFQIPFGVVEFKDGKVKGIDEKPLRRFFVNAGIYVLEPETLKQVPVSDRMDMPSFLNHLKVCGMEIAAFPIREFWLDVGRMDDLARAHQEFAAIFS